MGHCSAAIAGHHRPMPWSAITPVRVAALLHAASIAAGAVMLAW